MPFLVNSFPKPRFRGWSMTANVLPGAPVSERNDDILAVGPLHVFTSVVASLRRTKVVGADTRAVGPRGLRGSAAPPSRPRRKGSSCGTSFHQVGSGSLEVARELSLVPSGHLNGSRHSARGPMCSGNSSAQSYRMGGAGEVQEKRHQPT